MTSAKLSVAGSFAALLMLMAGGYRSGGGTLCRNRIKVGVAFRKGEGIRPGFIVGKMDGRDSLVVQAVSFSA